MAKPHIILITTDEQHLRTLFCYGAQTGSTPCLDALAEQADVYENAYTPSPVCLPARCSLMTGLYPHHTGSISNDYGASLSLQLPNLFTQLRQAGYRTSLHGKCHFVPVPYASTRADKTLEYEHFIAYYRCLGMDTLNLQDDKNNSTWFYDDYAKDLYRKDLLKAYRYEAHQNRENHGYFDFPGEDAMHPDAWVGRKAAEYIQSCPGGPEFLWVSFSGPHYPIDTPRAYTERIDPEKMGQRIFRPGEWDDPTKFHTRGYFGPGSTEGSGSAPGGAQKTFTEEYWTQWRRRYLGNIALIDEKIGEILRAAEEKFGDDLLVIFTADHGEMMGNHSLWGKNSSLYEDVLRVPLLVRRPGQKTGRRIRETVSTLDLFPTILRAAGISQLPPCDGRPLDETVQAGGRPWILSECADRLAVIRDGVKLELNRVGEKGPMYRELYDLRADPYEFENRYGLPDYLQAERDLTALLEADEDLLPTILRDPETGDDYWRNLGNGAGLARNQR